MAPIDPEKAALLKENSELKSKLKSLELSSSIEINFHKLGGKESPEDDLISYFDIVRGYALRFIKLDNLGKISFVDPLDGLPLKTSSGKDFTMRDLMIKIKSSRDLAHHFDSGSNAATKNLGYTTRESLREIKDPAARLARARELGIK